LLTQAHATNANLEKLRLALQVLLQFYTGVIMTYNYLRAKL